MLAFMALDKAESAEVDGGFLRVTYSPVNAMFKNTIESKDNRKLIEEVCFEVLKQRIVLSASVGAQPKPADSPKPKTRTNVREPVEKNPTVRSIVDKFHGEIIEVIKPEN